MKWKNRERYVIHARGVSIIAILIVIRTVSHLNAPRHDPPAREITEAFQDYIKPRVVTVAYARTAVHSKDTLPERQKTKKVKAKERLELNTADSLDLLQLYGIGPYYARKILLYRDKLGGYVHPEQLLEIEGMDHERFGGFGDRLKADASLIQYIDLQEAPEIQLAGHPYIGKYLARSIVRFRELVGADSCRLEILVREKVLSQVQASKIALYVCR